MKASSRRTTIPPLPGARRRVSGFTIPELLVVMGLATVLMLALVGVTNSVSTRFKDARCLSNLRVLGVHLLSQAQENHGELIHVYGGSFNPGSALQEQALYWTTRLRNKGYLSNDEINALVCSPELLEPEERAKKRLTKSHYGFYMAGPYGENEREVGNSGAVFRLRLASTPEPSRCIVLADSLDDAGHQFAKIYAKKMPWTKGAVHTRHHRKAHLFFLDGHTEAAGPERLSDLLVPGFYDSEGIATPLATP